LDTAVYIRFLERSTGSRAEPVRTEPARLSWDEQRLTVGQVRPDS
jgi:hypothetical protein